MEKFKEGGKNITFLSYDDAYGQTDKVLAFVQQFDAAFGGEHFTERSKLRHVAMHFQKSARQWWASLRTQGIAPRTWKECRQEIMNQFLTDQAKDDVLTAWRGLKLDKGETIQKYTDKFWDLHLKATIFKKIDFPEQKQQLCAGLNEDMKAYVNAQKPKTISEVIHHAMVASKIFPSSKGVPKQVDHQEKTNEEDWVMRDARPFGNKDSRPNNGKKKDKNGYKCQNPLTPKVMEKYCKEN